MNKKSDKFVKRENKYDDDPLVFDWIVEKNLWWWFKVKLKNWFTIEAKVKWNLRKNKIKIIIWDTAQVKLNEFDPTKWYIVYRK